MLNFRSLLTDCLLVTSIGFLPGYALAPSPTVERFTILNSPIEIAQANSTFPVNFASGSSSAEMSDWIERGTRHIYLLNARAGQTMSVEIYSEEDNAVFDVFAPNGTPLDEETTSTTIDLPSSGDYRIIVGSTRGNANYSLEVSID